MDERARRIAENEARFREINERLRTDLQALPEKADPVQFICECGRLECVLSIDLTFEEYERVRSDPLAFAVAPGHEIPDVEDVVASSDHHVVVRKHPETAPIVRERDPRSDG